MKRLILYDLDGTLVDTREDIARAVNHMRAEMGESPLPQKQIEGCVGTGLHALIRSCLGSDDERRIQKASKIYRDFYAAHMLDASRLYPGAEEALRYFSPRPQAVLTNKPDPFSREILEALGVAHYFFEIVAGDSGYSKKPDPAAVFALMEKSGANPGEVLFVGDSLVDLETGRRAGIRTVLLTHGFTGADQLKSSRPDALAGDFYELIALAKKEGW